MYNLLQINSQEKKNDNYNKENSMKINLDFYLVILLVHRKHAK